MTYRHQMLGAALIHPDKREVIPLMPEPIIKQDGTAKNDCERNAAKRFITKLRQDHPHLKVIVTEDSLSSNAPHIQWLHDHDLHYILGVKEGDHAALFAYVEAAEHAGRVTYYDRDEPETGLHQRFRFLRDVPPTKPMGSSGSTSWSAGSGTRPRTKSNTDSAGEPLPRGDQRRKGGDVGFVGWGWVYQAMTRFRLIPTAIRICWRWVAKPI